ncbi:MAG TPA: zinc-dependent metalloprotease [Thermoanaerobaculia bacterium]|nr:zinc-dependent metalloprotease [Thermoanaerobaculia bacterium]
MRLFALALLLLAAPGPVPEKSPSPQEQAERAADRTPTIAERVKDIPRHDGFLPFYWDARKGQLLIEVSRWNEDFLYGSGLAGGAGLVDVMLDRGQLGGLGLCRFERAGPRVLLHQRQTTHRGGAAGGETARVAEESFPSSVLASLPIAAEDGDRVLADATAFLLADTAVLPILKQARLGDWKQDTSRSALALERSGAFPKNTEIEMIATFTAENPPGAFAGVLPDGHTMSLRIHHTFLRLPGPGFAPRPLDPRIGFIPRRYFDHAARWNEPIEKFLASRWRLVRRDPKAALSEPVEPIVYYLDRGIPEPERSAIRRGALWWNHAFEQAGFKDAFVVRDLPEGATFLDARYSGIEWVNRAERGWSVGGSQTDPRTGEILHGVARIDSHRRRTTSRMWRNMRPPGAFECDAGDSPDLAWLAAGDPTLDEESLVLDRLAYLSAHEVGHTIGLMHNWAATTFGWGSVMDYLAPNVQIKDGRLDLSDAYPKDIGSYDRLAIQWGYTAEDDPKLLDRIVREGYAKGIFYPADGDPRWAEYDWGEDPVRWLATTQRVRRVILDRFGLAQLAAGQWLYDLQERFSLAYLYHRFGIQTAQQFVGGQYQANAVAGDGQTPVAWVPAGRQKEAVELLIAAISPENLDIPDRVLAALVPPPSGTRGSQEQFRSEAGAAFSLFTAARALVGLVVDPLLDPARAARLTLPSPRDALTLDGLISRLVAATWGAPADASPRKAALRRISQRGVLDAMMDLAASAEASPEARAVVHARLALLKTQLRGRHAADPAAEAHLRLAERDLAEFLEKPEVRKGRPQRPAAPPGRPIGE